MTPNDARCTREIEFSFHGKSSIRQEEGCFHQQIGLKVKAVTSEVLYLRHGFL
jgi:hypothetical protein